MSQRLFQKEKYYWWKVLLDGLLLAAAFYLVYFFKREGFFQGEFLRLEPNFRRFFPVLLGVWLVVTLLSKKFTQLREPGYFNQLKPYIYSTFALAGILNIILYVLGWYYLSRLIVFGSIALFFVFELILFSLRSVVFFPGEHRKSAQWVPVTFFLAEFFLLIASFTAIYYYKKRTLKPRDDYLLFLMGVIFLWIVISLLVHRFDIRPRESYFKTLLPFLESQLVIMGIVSAAMFLANLVFFSRTVTLGTLGLFAVLENLAVSVYYLLSRPLEETRTRLFRAEVQEEEPEIEEIEIPEEKEKYRFPGSQRDSSLLPEQLKSTYLDKFAPVFDFTAGRVHLEKLDILHSTVIYNRSPYNIEIFRDDWLEFFTNLQEINDFRRINKNLVLVNRKMKTGGILVGRFEDLVQTRERLYNKYPFVLVRAIYPFHFLFKRAFPKLPLCRKIYFMLTRGHNRVISKAEAMGRLYFCGFEIIDSKEIDAYTWFIAKKIGEPARDKNPSYGIFFKQKRLGKEGKFIYIYKLRTMHPYSEYIHKYVLHHYELGEEGKISHDFRVTPWGKFFRRIWLDELPALVNWIKREVKLVGVRPLSISFFDTYPEDLKQERLKYKPGLVPPYYADMPGSIEEVWESERRYLKKYAKQPIRTDFVYFFKAMKNILFHHAKSE